ncbi:hypothetical protein MMC30_008865 [Trapelia coarctata]|nr:hypothetical protein [Trapelia coarctata]
MVLRLAKSTVLESHLCRFLYLDPEFLSDETPPPPIKMPALNLALTPLIPRTSSELVKRINNDNWAGHNPGVVLVFCIVFIVALGLISLFVYRKMLARRAARVGH